jgi:hypothetical protein
MYAKLKEEFGNKEVMECTFKPKINKVSIEGKADSVEVEDSSKRWEKLFKMGTQIISTKKDKPREEIEKELHGEHCTFKPDIKSRPVTEDDSKFKNDIYDKSYELLYTRLKNGRVERMIKDSVHERGEFPSEIDEYCKK